MVSPARSRGARMVAFCGCLFGMFAATVEAQLRPQTQTQRRAPIQIARRDSDDLSKFLLESESRSVGDSIFYRTESAADLQRLNMPTVRTLLNKFAADVNRLYQQVRTESRYTPRLRSMEPDAVKLRARATMLAQDAQTERDLTRVASGVREIDTDWRQFSHNLKHVPQVPNSILQLVATLDRTSNQIEKAFEIEPQFDRRELLTQVMAMRADFDNLIDDIELEMGTAPEARELVRRVRSIRTQAAYSADLIAEQGEYSRVVEAYKRAETDWKPVAVRLASVHNRYIDRSVRRIVHSGNVIKQLLWLENDADITELINTANTMRGNVDEFFKRTPLLLMVKFENPQAALQAANSFYDACDIYTEQVQGGADVETLMEVFRDLQATGNDFLRTFRPLPSKQGQLVLSDISRDLGSLQEMAQSHYGGDGFDLIAATESSAEMETLADHIDWDLRQWLRNSNDPNSRQALALSKQFKTRTSQLSEAIAQRRPRQQIRTMTEAVYKDWNRLSQILRRAPQEDQQHMASISRKLSASLLSLMVPLDL